MKKIIYKGMMDGLVTDRAVREHKYDMVKHWHPECELQYYIEGQRLFFIEEEEYLAQAGSLVLIKPQSIHRTYSHKHLYHDRILLLLEVDKFVSVSNYLGRDLTAFFEDYQGLIQVPVLHQKTMYQLLKTIADEVMDKKQGYQKIVGLKLIELCLLISRMQEGKRADGSNKKVNQVSDMRMDQIKQYIRGHLATGLSLQQIAEAFYMDKSYLCRRFKSTTGYTITEYTNMYRVKEAQRLLEDTDLCLTDITAVTGFKHITYFNRVFNKYTETSPLQYRKKKNVYKKSLREKNHL